MSLNLKNRNVSGVLLAYVKMGSEFFYCMAETEYWIGEYWIGEYWNGYVDLTQGNLESQYFKFLKRFRLDYRELCSEYKKLDLNDVFGREGNKPCLYVDFDNKYFASYYQEQELERRVPKEWKGEYRKVANLIPAEYKYW